MPELAHYRADVPDGDRVADYIGMLVSVGVFSAVSVFTKPVAVRGATHRACAH